MSRLLLPHVPVTLHDILQVITGATLLGIPVGFTQEVWELARVLPWANIFAILIISVTFIAAFIYYQYYKLGFANHHRHFFGRVAATYVFSFITVAVLLTILQKAYWLFDPSEALKLIIIVTLPASMSAAVADTLH